MKSNESTLSQVKLFNIRSAQKMSWKWKNRPFGKRATRVKL